MLRAYLISVLVYALILYILPIFCIDKIIKNGWATPCKPAPFRVQLLYSFLFAAMPVVRVFLVCGDLFLAITPHEKDQDNDKTN